MKQILFEASFNLEEQFTTYEALEENINNRYRSASFFKPSEAFTENLTKINPFYQA